jgi:hypothetical protein
VANNNKLLIGAIGCLFLTAMSGLSCMGLGTLGWFLYTRNAAPEVAAATPVEKPASTRVDLLSDAAFLDVSAGPFAAPTDVGTEPEAAPSEPARPVIHPPAPRPSPRPAVTAPEPSAPEAPPAEDDQEPIISDEDVQALDAEVQQIEAEREAAAATESKKKKKKN